MFELKHLKTLTALKETGNIKKAAAKLFTSQSALSHQIKDLEQRLGEPLFIRNTSPVEFSHAGQVLLDLAKEIFPAITNAEQALKTPTRQAKNLKLAIACHACFQWLLPISQQFSQQHPALAIEFLDDDFQQQALSADILFTDYQQQEDNYLYQEIGQFEVIAVSALNDPTLGCKYDYVEAEQFKSVTLLTYPLPNKQLDIFQLFLTPKGITPAKIKQVNNSHVMLQMAAAGMGVATLPDWLVSSLSQQALLTRKRLGEAGLYKKLYAKYQANTRQRDIIEQLIPQVIAAFKQLYVV